MPVSLLHRAYQLKEALKHFGLTRFKNECQALLERAYPDEAPTDDERYAFEDWFVLEHILNDRRTVLSHFLDSLETEADLVIAQQWGMVIQGVFHVRQVLPGNHFELMNLVNDVSYTVAGNPQQELALEKSEYILARLLPHQDFHFFTGVIDRLPTRKKNEIYELVTQIQLQNPKMAFIDNVDRIEMAYKIQQEELADFKTFFGDDEIDVRARNLDSRLKEFYHYRFFQKKQASGATIAKTFQDKYHQAPLPPQFDFLDQLDPDEELTIIYDQTEGMVIFVGYPTFRQVFALEDFKSVRNYAQVVQNYLTDPHISSLPFQRMAAQYPENFVEVMKAVLRRKRFKMPGDLNKIIQRYKPMEELLHHTPSAIPSSVRSKTFLRSLKARFKW